MLLPSSSASALTLSWINENLKSGKLRDIALAEKAEAEDAKAELESQVGPLRQEVVKNQQQIEQFPIKLRQEKEKFDTQMLVEKSKFEGQLSRQQDEHAKQLKQEQDKLSKELLEEQEKMDAKLVAEQRKLETEKKRLSSELEVAQKNFEVQTRNLVKQKDELNQQVDNLNESSKLLRYKSRLTNVMQELESGDFQQTRKLLDAFEDQGVWEWRRMNLLAHREIEAIYPDEPMTSFAASLDGKRFAMIYRDRVELRDTADFQRAVLSIPVKGATATALSRDGSTLAVGRPAESAVQPGTIWIVDLSDLNAPQQLEKLDAQSESITRLQFSDDSSKLLSVGSPSRIRKAAGGLEEELMVWDSNWNKLDVKLVGQGGSLPKFSHAEFSRSGNRIVATNPIGVSKDLVAHVFEVLDDSVKWLSTSPIDGINVATFGDDNGVDVVACARDAESGGFSLVTWVVDGSQRGTQFISASTRRQDSSVRTVAQLKEKALFISKKGNWLVTAGQDKQATILGLEYQVSDVVWRTLTGHRLLQSCCIGCFQQTDSVNGLDGLESRSPQE